MSVRICLTGKTKAAWVIFAYGHLFSGYILPKHFSPHAVFLCVTSSKNAMNVVSNIYRMHSSQSCSKELFSRVFQLN